MRASPPPLLMPRRLRTASMLHLMEHSSRAAQGAPGPPHPSARLYHLDASEKGTVGEPRVKGRRRKPPPPPL